MSKMLQLYFHFYISPGFGFLGRFFCCCLGLWALAAVGGRDYGLFQKAACISELSQRLCG